MKLNPQKYIFGVTAGKFFGFMVTHRGIVANLAKIQVAINVKSPTTCHDIQRLNERIAVLSNFLAKGAKRSLPFMNLLRGILLAKRKTKKHVVEWTAQCEEAFN